MVRLPRPLIISQCYCINNQHRLHSFKLWQQVSLLSFFMNGTMMIPLSAKNGVTQRSPMLRLAMVYYTSVLAPDGRVNDRLSRNQSLGSIHTCIWHVHFGTCISASRISADKWLYVAGTQFLTDSHTLSLTP